MMVPMSRTIIMMAHYFLSSMRVSILVDKKKHVDSKCIVFLTLLHDLNDTKAQSYLLFFPFE